MIFYSRKLTDNFTLCFKLCTIRFLDYAMKFGNSLEYLSKHDDKKTSHMELKFKAIESQGSQSCEDLAKNSNMQVTITCSDH